MDQGTSTLFMIFLVFVMMYFFMIRPENKRKKQAQEMRDALKKGDTITTIGGIVGKVVFVSEGTIVIETSDDRVRMEVTKWAVAGTGVQTRDEVPAKKKKNKKDEEPAPVPEEPQAAAEAENKED